MKLLKNITFFSFLLAGVFWFESCQKIQTSSTPQNSCNFVQNSEGQRVSWGGMVPVTLYVDSSVPKDYYTDLENAAAVWNKSVGHEVIRIGGWVSKSGGAKQDNQNVIFWLNSWDSNKTNEQARTTIYWTGSRITEADIMIDAANFTYSVDQLAADKVDFTSLMVHEFGHVLGLKHVDGQSSVMQASLPNNYERRVLQSVDMSSIHCEY